MPAIEKIRQFGTAKKIQSGKITTENCLEFSQTPDEETDQTK